MFPVVWVEIARSFKKNTALDTFLAIFTLGFYSFYLNYAAKDLNHVKDRSLQPRTELGDWVSSILFAVVAATIVHTYFIQPFVIPTSSLEKTLLVGDFLFVSKVHYGARTPETTVALPMIHDAIPGTSTPSYFKFPQLPKFRFPAFQSIKRNDIVVFNWPVDTLVDINNENGGIRYKPVDKKTNYVKRCVGLPGDTLSIKDGYVHINGKKNELPDRAKLQFFYKVILNDVSAESIYQKYGITENYERYVFKTPTDNWNKPEFQNYLKVKKIGTEVLKQDSTEVRFLSNLDQKSFDLLKLEIAEKALYVNLTEDLANIMTSDPDVLTVTKDLSNSTTENIFPKSPALKLVYLDVT